MCWQHQQTSVPGLWRQTHTHLQRGRWWLHCTSFIHIWYKNTVYIYIFSKAGPPATHQLSSSSISVLFAAIPFPDKERWFRNKLFLCPSRIERSLFRLLVFTSVSMNAPTWFKRINTICVNTSISVRDLTGLTETWSMFQTFMKKHPQETVYVRSTLRTGNTHTHMCMHPHTLTHRLK